VLTPYIDSVGDVVVSHLTASGFEIVTQASFKKPGDPDIARLAPRSIAQAAIALGSDTRIDGIFISCTALRESGVLAKMERVIRKPVVSSNQALAWHCLRLAGHDDSLFGGGRLLMLPIKRTELGPNQSDIDAPATAY